MMEMTHDLDFRRRFGAKEWRSYALSHIDTRENRTRGKSEFKFTETGPSGIGESSYCHFTSYGSDREGFVFIESRTKVSPFL